MKHHAIRTNLIDGPRLGTLQEAARFLVCSERSVRRYAAAGELTLYRVGPRGVRVDLAEVEAFARRVPTAG